MLVDELEHRYDSVAFVEVEDNMTVEINSTGIPHIFVMEDGTLKVYSITDSALDELLNFLRIPIKYVKRCLEDEVGIRLAADNINFWIAQKRRFSLLVVDDMVTNVFDGKRIYMPSVTVNDIICEQVPNPRVVDYKVDDDVFHAVYVSGDPIELANGITVGIGIRALYSDCFILTPRFDGVVWDENSKAMYCWPVKGRKFRAASTTTSQVMEQINDFIALSLTEIKETLLPALEGEPRMVDPKDFINRMVSELRFNRKQQEELLGAVVIDDQWHSVKKVIIEVSSHLQDDPQNFDFNEIRDIQVSMTQFIVSGQFK